MPRTSSIGRAACATSSPKRSVTATGSGAADSQSPPSASVPARNSSAAVAPQRCRARRPDSGPHAGTGWAWRPQVKRERADRDHHRVPGADLGELLRPAGERNEHRGDQLVVSQRAALGAQVELLGRDEPRPAHRRGLHDGPGGQQDRVAVPGRRGRAEVAADRAAVADLRGTDGPGGQGQARRDAADLGDDPGVGQAGAEADLSAGPLPRGELGDPGQVEQRLRPPRVEVDLYHDVGAARDGHRAGNLRLGRDRVGQRPGLQEVHRPVTRLSPEAARHRGGSCPR